MPEALRVRDAAAVVRNHRADIRAFAQIFHCFARLSPHGESVPLNAVDTDCENERAFRKILWLRVAERGTSSLPHVTNEAHRHVGAKGQLTQPNFSLHLSISKRVVPAAGVERKNPGRCAKAREGGLQVLE